jgi:signal peptidase I
MFFNSFRRKVKELGHFLRKKVDYRRDLLNTKDLKKSTELLDRLQELRRTPKASPADEAELEQIRREVEILFPPRPGYDGWAENVEVVFVAVVLALALRTYVAQPFKIPTDSMKPTLWGIWTQPEERPTPHIFQRITDFAVHGRSWHEVKATRQESLRGLTQEKLFGVLPITVTRIVTSGGSYLMWATADELIRGAPHLVDRSGPRPVPSNLQFNPGDTIARFTVASGDHVFVNKFIYHFRRPDPGEVFVFTTHGIRGINERNRLSGTPFNQFYIKRCVGVGGDQLEIRPPYLLRNGAVMATRPIFEKIQSDQNGYQGYGQGSPYLAAGETFQLPLDEFWAMGDNSFNSYDSRGWGSVPRQNLVGTGLLVYWPFTQRWGLIR